MATRRLVIISMLVVAACKATPTQPKLTLKASKQKAPLDRLKPEEELPGRERVFGMEVPRGLRLTLRQADVAQMSGRRRLEDITRYFQQQVAATHIEATGRRVVFPKALIKALGSERAFRIEIVELGRILNVRITDITPPPVARGLDEQERWKRAGRNPDGSQRNRKLVF